MWGAWRSGRVLHGEVAVGDLVDFLADGDHRVDEPVDLGQVLGLGGLHHQRARDRERQGGGVETVIDQALGHILGGHTGLGGQLAQVQDALVRHQPALTGVEDREVLVQPGRDVVRREQRATWWPRSGPRRP